MRLRITLLLLVLLTTGGHSFAQKITIVERNIPLSKVFSLIQQQSGFSLLYDNNLVKKERNIDVEVRNASLEETLVHCLKGLPLTFVITDKIIVIREKEKKQGPDTTTVAVLKGNVSDAAHHYLAGASVLIRELKKGVQTKTSGDFLVENIRPGTYTVEVSFVGYETVQQTIAVDERSVNHPFILKEAENRLEGIIITALGLGRKSRTLTYSMQSIAAEDLSTVKNTNVLNSLNGKVAGVQVNRTSGGAGGSVRVVLRGDKSTRNSQPLYVVDGLPIVNPTGGPDPGLYNSAPDAGDILSSINPDDIESVNVLKGASASALYGSQGSNGVILITTKKGKSGTAKVDFSSSITFDKPFVYPQLQYNYNQSTPQTAGNPGSEDSWGSKGATLPNSNYVKDFFQTGITFINSISLSSGNEKSSNYLSYSNTDNKGILPTSTFRQNTLSFRQSSKLLNDKLIFDGTFIGSIQNAHNRLTPGIYFNPLTGLYLFPRGLDFNSYKNYAYFSQSRYLSAQNWWNINYDKDQANGGGWGGQDYQQNPYWVLNRNPVDNKNQNVYASVSLKYLLTNWLTLQARGNINHFINEYQRNVYATTQGTLSRFNGSLAVAKSNSTTRYGDLLLTGERSLNKDLGLNFTAGTSIQDQQGNMTIINGSPTVPNVFLESALDRATLDIRNFNADNGAPARKRIQSVFASAQLGYRNKLFADLSTRSDWSSTLAFTPTEKKGYNYYSIGSSAVLSELLQLPAIINFAKLRISYAVVGNDIAAFSTYPLYTFSNGGLANLPGSSPVNTVPGLELKPEKNKSFEIGTQWAFLQNRLSVDITWYQSNIIHQYFRGIIVPPGLGTGGLADINAGDIQNTGLEVFASYKIAHTKPFGWTTSINFSHNKNRIAELFNSSVAVNPSPNQLYRLLGGSGGGDGVLKLGGSYGDIYGRAFQRDANGHVVVNAVTGLPYLEDEKYLGNPNPVFILGWKNSFTMKQFVVNVLVDGKFGGQVLSITDAYLDQMGVSKRTGEARDRDGKITIDHAVDETGRPWPGSTDAATYYKYIGGKTPVGEAYISSATAIRLREFSIIYRLPMRNKIAQSIQLGIIGNNLFFFKKAALFDPEQVAGVNPGGVGVDVFGLPAYRSIGFSLNCTF